MIDRTLDAAAVSQEVRQFKKLQHLSDHDVAHRMAITLASVKTYRRQFRQLDHSLTDIGINYEVRVLLGKAGVKYSQHLFAYSDRKLLSLPGIGPARLEHIRQKTREFLA